MNHSEMISPTRDKIVESALRLFSERGYLGATTKDIARDAGVAEITLFRHFPSKEKLFEEVLSMHSFLPVLRGLLPEIAKMPYKKALVLIAERFLETLESRKEMIQIMHSEVRRYPEKIHKIYHGFIEEMLRTLASYFDELHRKGVVREFDTENGARAFFGMFFSYFNTREIHLFRKYGKIDSEKVMRDFIDIFIRGTAK